MPKKMSHENQIKCFKSLKRNGFFNTASFYLELKNLGSWNVTKAVLYSGKKKLVTYNVNFNTMPNDTLALNIKPTYERIIKYETATST